MGGGDNKRRLRNGYGKGNVDKYFFYFVIKVITFDFMEKKCLNCGKAIVQIEGRREKKYCNDKCRATYFQKHKPKKRKYVQFKTFQELQERFNQAVNENKPQGDPKTENLPQPPQKEEKPASKAKNVSKSVEKELSRTEKMKLLRG